MSSFISILPLLFIFCLSYSSLNPFNNFVLIISFYGTQIMPIKLNSININVILFKGVMTQERFILTGIIPTILRTFTFVK